MKRLRPKIVLRTRVVNRSSRGGQRIRGIVVHATQSANVTRSRRDLAGVVSWFANPAADASAHVITDADGHSARCVPDSEKAWHAAAYNAATLGIEQVGYASQRHWPEDQLRETARWIALWSERHDIPIRRGRVVAGRVVRRGVVRHSQLGAAGGGHTDPGDGWPMGRVLRMAREIKRESKRRRQRKEAA